MNSPASDPEEGAAVETTAVSVHRAFAYAVGAPGWGEWYAGFRLRAAGTVAALVVFFVWFTWALWRTSGAVTAMLASSLGNVRSIGPTPEIPGIELGISVLGLYVTWAWGVVSAVDCAVEARASSRVDPQRHGIWPLVLSWLSPGSGQIYEGRRGWGFALWGVWLAGLFLGLGAVADMAAGLKELLGGGAGLTEAPKIVAAVRALSLGTTLGTGQLLQLAVWTLAFLETCRFVRTAWGEPGSPRAYAVLLGAAWLCPGGAQMLQGREKAAVGVAALFVGSQVLLGLLLGADLLDASRVDTLMWVPTLVQWGALAEAPVRGGISPAGGPPDRS